MAKRLSNEAANSPQQSAKASAVIRKQPARARKTRVSKPEPAQAMQT